MSSGPADPASSLESVSANSAATRAEDAPARSPARRRSLFFRAALAGLLAGVIAVAFELALDGFAAIRESLANVAPAGAARLAFGLIFSAAAVAAGVWLVRRFAPEAAGSGIPHLERVLDDGAPFRWARVLWVKFVGGALAIGGGMALGREGPTVQMGAAVGRAVAPPDDVDVLVAAGAGAGLAAAFNAPLAGAAFVAEELRGAIRPTWFLAALLAATIADVVARRLVGQQPVFDGLLLAVPPLALLPGALVIGIAGGIAGVLFNAGVSRSLDATDALRARIGPIRLAAAIGAVVGLVGFWRPGLIGGGHGLLVDFLHASPGLGAVLAIAVVRTILTLAGYASGAAGGLFMPLLVLGACLGAAASHAPRPEGVEATVPVVLGMAAIFAGSVRAPATGVLLMIEMTGGYPMILPLLTASLAAELTAGELGGRPIYTALRERDEAAADAAKAAVSAPSSPIP